MWCVVIMRRMPCTDQDGAKVDVEDPVAVLGPCSKIAAHKTADRFNRDLPGEDREKVVDNAPDFIRQEDWDEHWALVLPMNIVP